MCKYLSFLCPPGVIPASFNDQLAAQRLAMCNDIGEASYVDSLIAAAMLDTFSALPSEAAILQRLEQRYGIGFLPDMTGEVLEPFILKNGSFRDINCPLNVPPSVLLYLR